MKNKRSEYSLERDREISWLQYRLKQIIEWALGVSVEHRIERCDMDLRSLQKQIDDMKEKSGRGPN